LKVGELSKARLLAEKKKETTEMNELISLVIEALQRALTARAPGHSFFTE
jgi:Xaa-Pro aminopeptidase